MQPAIRAVLFDAGDTLFRLRGSVGSVYAAVAARHGVTLPDPALDHRFREAFRAMPPLAFPGARPDALPALEYDWWRRLVREVFRGVAFADFETFYADLYRAFGRAALWELFADVPPTLAALRARGLRLGIVSNFDSRLFAICEGLGIRAAFDTIVTSVSAGAAKPNPAIFLDAVGALTLAPAEALHVGDSLREDVAGARAAGLRAVHLVRPERGAAGSTPAIASLAELLDLLPAA